VGAAAKSTRWRAAAVFTLVFVVYNVNGREIASYDSQPTKLAAIELVRYHTLTLDRVVLRAPALAERPGFTLDRDGRYRSAYPALPAVMAAGVAFVLRQLHLVDLGAPLAAGLVAKLTASLLTALAVAFAFIAARRRLPVCHAALVAFGLGLGTNLWASSSQTLWQTETAVAAMAGAVLCLAVPLDRLTSARLWGAALMLGLAGAARPQLAPAIAVVAISIATRRGRASDLAALLPLAVAAGIVATSNIRWFGHVLGAMPRLESLHPTVHALAGTFGNPLVGAAGLLVSPSRGVLVFSPIVLVALAGLPQLRRQDWQGDLRWWSLAALVEFAFYASYRAWWGGHTYGPRYMLDVLPILVPLAAEGVAWVSERRWRRRLAAAALAWSIVLAGTGAFVYPHEEWNSSPTDVDRHHARLWDFSDPQFVRCWTSGWNSSSFRLFSKDSVHR
jgi:hypothetical protein